MTDQEKLSHRLMMFLLLSTEAEKWGLSLIGLTKFEFKFRVNNYLKSADSLLKYAREHGLSEDLEDISESFSMIIGCLASEKRDELLSLINSYLAGDVTIVNK